MLILICQFIDGNIKKAKEFCGSKYFVGKLRSLLNLIMDDVRLRRNIPKEGVLAKQSST